MKQLPWLSVPEHPFPPRIPRRRRRSRMLQSSSVSVEFPAKESQRSGQADVQRANKRIDRPVPAAPSEPQTPTTSAIPSDANSTQPTTPSSAAQAVTSRSQSQSRTQTKGSKPAVPLVPVVPIVPQAPSTPRQSTKDDASRSSETPKTSAAADATREANKETVERSDDSEQPKQVSPPRAVPKSWADLVRSKALPRNAGAPGAAAAGSGDLMVHKAESLADVLSRLGEDVTQYSDKVAFLEPRGLVNTGNMCYMNSVCRPALPLRAYSDRI